MISLDFEQAGFYSRGVAQPPQPQLDGRASAITYDRGPAVHGGTNATETVPSSNPNPVEFVHCFLRLANLPNFALDRPALDALDRRLLRVASQVTRRANS